METDKYASEFPLPGGVEHYYDTLLNLLVYIRDRDVPASGLPSYFFTTFPDAVGQVAVNGYISSLNRMDLWTNTAGRLKLSAEGAAIVAEATADPASSRRRVWQIKVLKILGYDSLCTYLLEEARSIDQIRSMFSNALGVSWKTPNQAVFRVNWLRSLGYVAKDGKQYSITEAGRNAFANDARLPPPLEPTPPPLDCRTDLLKEAECIGQELIRQSTAGGDGRAFESAVQKAFEFLGFDSKLISGAGNPDVLAIASIGELSYKILIDAKSRSGGLVQQNDVNFPALDKQRQGAGADYTLVVGPGFSNGNLISFALNNNTRLMSVEDLGDLLLCQAESILPLDLLRKLFIGGGLIDESTLAELQTRSEGQAETLELAKLVFDAIQQHQTEEGRLSADSLYYILEREYSLSAIEHALTFLSSDLISALRIAENGSLCTRLTPPCLHKRIQQILEAFADRDSRGASA